MWQQRLIRSKLMYTSLIGVFNSFSFVIEYFFSWNKQHCWVSDSFVSRHFTRSIQFYLPKMIFASCVIFMLFETCWFSSKSFFPNNSLRNIYHQRVKQFGSRPGSTFSWTCSGAKLYAKVYSRSRDLKRFVKDPTLISDNGFFGWWRCEDPSNTISWPSSTCQGSNI